MLRFCLVYLVVQREVSPAFNELCLSVKRKKEENFETVEQREQKRSKTLSTLFAELWVSVKLTHSFKIAFFGHIKGEKNF